MEALRCPYCGAPLEHEEDGELLRCPYCGSELVERRPPPPPRRRSRLLLLLPLLLAAGGGTAGLALLGRSPSSSERDTGAPEPPPGTFAAELPWEDFAAAFSPLLARDRAVEALGLAVAPEEQPLHLLGGPFPRVRIEWSEQLFRRVAFQRPGRAGLRRLERTWTSRLESVFGMHHSARPFLGESWVTGAVELHLRAEGELELELELAPDPERADRDWERRLGFTWGALLGLLRGDPQPPPEALRRGWLGAGFDLPALLLFPPDRSAEALLAEAEERFPGAVVSDPEGLGALWLTIPLSDAELGALRLFWLLDHRSPPTTASFLPPPGTEDFPRAEELRRCLERSYGPPLRKYGRWSWPARAGGPSYLHLQRGELDFEPLLAGQHPEGAAQAWRRLVEALLSCG